MRFLSVAEGELRAAARRKGTHRLRWLTAGVFILFLGWLAWDMDLFKGRGSAYEIFKISSMLVFFYCLLVGAAGTADCISREKREGTLGLLFLTNLNSAEIVAGKLCSNGLALLYSLAGILPVMAILLLVGGVTFSIYWHTGLALTATVFYSLALGFLASTLYVRQFPAVSLASGMAILLGTGPFTIAQILRGLGRPRSMTDTISAFCPMHLLLASDSSPRAMAYTNYWYSMAAVVAISLFCLLLVVLRLKYLWRDRPRRARLRLRFGNKNSTAPRRRLNASSPTERQRSLNINPIYWLAGRQRVSAPAFMILIVAIVMITEWGTAPFFQRVFPAGAITPVVGHLFAWLWTGLLIHVLVLYYAASAASQQLAEDRQNGGLELILSTPTSERALSRGLWLAYARRMFFPAMAALLAHCFFIWQCTHAFLLDPPGNWPFPRDITAWKLFWSALMDQTLNGVRIEWELVFMTRMMLLILVAFVANWVMLGWMGRWLGLRMKHPGFAPILCAALTIVPPTIAFSVTCYALNEIHLKGMPERRSLPLLMWAGFTIVLINCTVLSYWAAERLRNIRARVASRFARTRPWWRPDFPSLFRTTRHAAILLVGLALLAGVFYLLQNWQARHRWSSFKKQLQREGESLDIAASLPPRAPDAQNFAKTEAFVNFRDKPGELQRRLGNQLTTENLVRLAAPTLGAVPRIGQSATSVQPAITDFEQHLSQLWPNYRRGTAKDRKQAATMVLESLKTVETNLNAVAPALSLRYFQPTTNRSYTAVTLTDTKTMSAMGELHYLFAIRANALLALERTDEATEDMLRSLKVADLARQSPDLASSQRVRMMMEQSLQVIWEGLAEHRWSGAQLEAIQKELSRFNLIADYTNNVHLATLAHLTYWISAAEKKNPDASPQRISSSRSPDEWEWQPRAWRRDNAIEFYGASRFALAQVDAPGGRMTLANGWSDLDGIQINKHTENLIRQYRWMNPDYSMVPFAQNALNQAGLAIAIERYRLENGKYPASLEELVPRFINNVAIDPISGSPMHYRLDQTNGFDMRGVGPNGALDPPGPSSDDWRWPTSVVTKTNAVSIPSSGARQ